MSDPTTSPMSETPDPSAVLASMSESDRQTWRMTGEVPSSTSTPPADSSPAEPAAQVASTDASPSPASEPGTGKGSKLKARSAELDTEIAELEAKLRTRAELRAKVAETPTQTDAPRQSSSPVTEETEPREDDPKYEGDFSKYLLDAAEYRAKKAVERTIQDRETRAKEAEAKAKRDADNEALLKGFRDRVEVAKQKYPDFEKVLKAPLPIVEGSPIDAWIMESEHGAEVLYHLGTHADVLQKINALPAIAQVRELARLEDQLTKGPVVKTVTSAPDPGVTLGSKSAADLDEADAALQRGDFAGYRAVMNRRESKKAE